MASLLPNDAVAISIGACLGALSRYHTGRLAAEYIAADPNKLGILQGWHTAAINVCGSFVLGCVAGSPTAAATNCAPKPKSAAPPSSLLPLSIGGLSPRAKLMLGVGFCGSFTTFSTFSVDVVTWLSKGQTAKALTYVMVNNVGGVAAAASGLMLVRKLFG